MKLKLDIEIPVFNTIATILLLVGGGIAGYTYANSKDHRSDVTQGYALAVWELSYCNMEAEANQKAVDELREKVKEERRRSSFKLNSVQ